MPANVTTRPNQYCAVGGVWRNPIEYVFSSAENYLTVEIYRVGSVQNTLIGKLRKTVFAGICTIDISGILQSQFKSSREYQRNEISADESSAFAYFIRYYDELDIFSGEPLWKSEISVRRFCVDAALPSGRSDYSSYVIGQEPVVMPPDDPANPNPAPLRYLSYISNSIPIGSPLPVCESTISRPVFSTLQNPGVGDFLYNDIAGSTVLIPIEAGTYRILIGSEMFSYQIVVDSAGLIIAKSACFP